MKTFNLDHVTLPAVRAGEWYELKPDPPTWHHCWSIQRAKEIMYAHRERLTSRIKLLELTEETTAAILLSKTYIEWDYVISDACDPRQAILLVEIDGIDWIIDGWHRVRRAMFMGWEFVPIFQLTPEEDMSCRICTCCKPAGENKRETNKAIAAIVRPALLEAGLDPKKAADPCHIGKWLREWIEGTINRDGFVDHCRRLAERRPDLKMENHAGNSHQHHPDGR